MAKRPRDRVQPNNLQPWPKGHAIAFNQTTLAKRPRDRVQPNNLQPWPKGHAIAFNQTTFNQ
ncbi:hypothetical protein BJP36_38495 [Moorena producens JHB]|uniref:Uncharacterized protein n=1 Tax=Moorena producens (strain JHB) TaxID=1454205 RepID=A0A9Q9SUN8_MOOP1|nr:hypothetical protein [Moorena producens]WAN69970.1 hypothetical protein BJP36_38495 [Moorena producens JHB]